MTALRLMPHRSMDHHNRSGSTDSVNKQIHRLSVRLLPVYYTHIAGSEILFAKEEPGAFDVRVLVRHDVQRACDRRWTAEEHTNV